MSISSQRMRHTAMVLALSISTTATAAAAVHHHSPPSSLFVSRGLRNLGNTCYLNAQIQCQFHIPRVRKILQDASPESSVGLKALQQLFQDMEASLHSGIAAAPVLLCSTLGIPVMEQQDSQEFWKLLLPALNVRELTDLYQGAFEDYITAVDGSNRERRREEPFLDLSLDVISRESVLDSLADLFGAPELLSGDNGWRPEKGADKIDALKGSLLKAQGLPSLLQLHLKRFQYDWEWDRMSKVNTRFSFPSRLELGPICSQTEKIEQDDAVYELQSVVVHVGEYGSGHYYAYVRPDVRQNTWYRFDDDRVTEVTLQEVVRDAYGGKTMGEVKRPNVLHRLMRGFGGSYGWGGSKSSAYMLQYVKRKDIEKLYQKDT